GPAQSDNPYKRFVSSPDREGTLTKMEHSCLPLHGPTTQRSGRRSWTRGKSMPLPDLSSIGQRSSHGGWGSGTRFMKKNGWDAPPYRKPHALRHSYATTMLKSGADLRLAKDQRGHASITITADICGQHVGRERQVH